MKIRLLPLLLAVLLPVLASSCTGWPRGWSAAKRGAHPADGLSGAWEGTWRSVPTGHTGKLRCAVFPKSPDTWEYRYRASWAKVLCAGFKVDCLAVRQKDGTWKISGERDLGPLFGGIFKHTGTVSGDGEKLDATYNAKLDHGTLTLRRVR